MDVCHILNSCSEIDDIISVEAKVATGFEFLAFEECKEKCHPYDIRKAKGRLLFNIKKDDYQKAFSLRSVDNVYLIFQALPSLVFENDKEKDLAVVKGLVEQVNWLENIAKWASIKDFTGITFPKLEEEENEKVMKYRVTCNRVGNHSFSSMDAARDFGGELQDQFHWKVDLKNFDLEVVLNIINADVYVCAALTKSSLHRRNITHFTATTLRSTISYCLTRLAEPVPGEIILDPMCGAGSIPLEAAIGFPYTYCLGGDNNETSVRKAAKNMVEINYGINEKLMKCAIDFSIKDQENSLNEANKNGVVDSKDDTSEEEKVDAKGKISTSVSMNCDFLLWSVKRLPLRESSVDVFITDLPFGKRSGRKQDCRQLYKSVLGELARVVRPKSGRASILTADKASIIQALHHHSKLWRQIRSFTINQGGLTASVFLLLRTAAAWTSQI